MEEPTLLAALFVTGLALIGIGLVLTFKPLGSVRWSTFKVPTGLVVVAFGVLMMFTGAGVKTPLSGPFQATSDRPAAASPYPPSSFTPSTRRPLPRTTLGRTAPGVIRFTSPRNGRMSAENEVPCWKALPASWAPTPYGS